MSDPRKRTRQLVQKLFTSPTLPLLGWTKAVESVVTAGPIVQWLFYAAAVTVLWVGADTLQEAADDVTDDVADAVEDTVDD